MGSTTVAIDKPDEIKFILGQSHFINSIFMKCCRKMAPVSSSALPCAKASAPC